MRKIVFGATRERGRFVRLLSGAVPIALLAGLAGAGPSSAEDTTPPPPEWVKTALPATDRGRIVGLWNNGGSSVRAAAEAALVGTDADVRRFLDSDLAVAQEQDDRALALKLVTSGGRGLRDAATAALNETPDQLRAFLTNGWLLPFETDQRVEATRIVTAGGRAVQEAGAKALDGTTDNVRQFLEEAQYWLRESDDRVKVYQLITAGGPATQAAGTVALDGTADDVREFLAVGQHVAHARDQEYATVDQLARQVAEAGAEADRLTKAAQDASNRAVVASQLAKQAAAKAAAETAAAKGDAAKAAAAAERAAQATERAVDAAKAAIAAARSANNAARVAASAASQAAYASANAERESTNALSAAAVAAGDKAKAENAAAAATAVNYLMPWISDLTAAQQASYLACKSSLAATNALIEVGPNVDAAEASAKQAADAADAAGVSSARTRRAADSAHRFSQEAKRAANAATGFADAASTAANQSAAAATSAAAHTDSARQAAAYAAQHAGEAATAAQQSGANADSAKKAADSATSAVAIATSVQELARKTEAEELTARTNEAVERARDLRAAYDQRQAEITKADTDRVALDEQATRLATQATAPDADPQQLTTDARRMALAVMKTRGPWSQSLAQYALSGTDEAVRAYARSGWQQAAARDERAKVRSLVNGSDIDAVNEAAEAVQNGDDAQIHSFLENGQYDVAASDYRVRIYQIMEKGERGVKEAGTAALDAGTTAALRKFLTTDQFTARVSDNRVHAYQLITNGTPEVKAAATIALEGPPTLLERYIATGQYAAQARDQLTANHVADVQRTIAESAQVAALAQQNAAEAQRVAAVARGAAEASSGFQAQAQKSAQQAAQYASQARTSAQQAAQTAAQAAQAAKTARTAQRTALSADTSARQSAAWAQSSASAAKRSADQASFAAQSARDSAAATGKSEHDADVAYKAAYQQYSALSDHYNFLQYEREQQQRDYERSVREARDEEDKQDFTLYDAWSQGGHAAADLIGSLPGADGVDVANCGVYILEGNFSQDMQLSCVSSIPVIGEWSAYQKFKRYGEKGIPIFDRIFGKKPKSVPCPRKNSFPAGTPVLMADRSARPIEDLKVGDEVIATDPTTGVTTPRRVTATIYTPDDRDFTRLTVATADGRRESLTTTDHHPFWAESRGAWVDAGGLTTTDTLRTSDGRAVPITDVDHRQGLQAAYNLTVEATHTYYVIAGTTSVLVHNDDCGLFENLEPEDKIHDMAPTPLADLSSATGKFIYVVMPDGEMRVTRLSDTYGHIDLAKGQKVAAAGEFKLYSGKLKSIDNKSGHYQPKGPRAQQVAEEAFRKAGFEVKANTYKERWQ
ncbi:polymorphic toxin-type HINT domain-containing protein [Kitasatospora sp. NPDC127111]|uniref:polymorphic toxin-type HINT domain-containing protein n=1 Tax=Kitasatospora sp. NPDC127111 TaxID=3345363 RepID=UPI003635A585